MPELPEVETTRTSLITYAKGATIQEVTLTAKKLRIVPPTDLAETLAGLAIVDLHRRGKYLVFEFAPKDSREAAKGHSDAEPQAKIIKTEQHDICVTGIDMKAELKGADAATECSVNITTMAETPKKVKDELVDRDAQGAEAVSAQLATGRERSEEARLVDVQSAPSTLKAQTRAIFENEDTADGPRGPPASAVREKQLLMPISHDLEAAEPEVPATSLCRAPSPVAATSAAVLDPERMMGMAATPECIDAVMLAVEEADSKPPAAMSSLATEVEMVGSSLQDAPVSVGDSELMPSPLVAEGTLKTAPGPPVPIGGTPYLLVHLGMSGWFCAWPNDDRELPPHSHLVILLNNGYKLVFNDARRFGLLDWCRTKADHPPILLHDQADTVWLTDFRLVNLGVEPLSNAFTVDYMQSRAKNRQVTVKQFLMDNAVVVGIGNIYAAEALFISKIHPLSIVANLESEDWLAIINAVQNVLNESIRVKGTTFRDFVHADGKPGDYSQLLRVYGRKGEACKNCQRPLKSFKLMGRSTVCCPQCQSSTSPRKRIRHTRESDSDED